MTEINWRYNENPPEPDEEEGIRCLAAIHDAGYDTRRVREMWYDGDGGWSDEAGFGGMGVVYAWAEWPDAPPLEEAS